MKLLYKAVKRAFDFLFSLLCIIILSPVYIITAAIIMIVSPGNPVYKAKRVGLHGKQFTLYKFRSMRKDSGKIKITTLENDDRIFPFGRWIRKVKIDETPQFFNILLNSMSVVGPRPEDKDNASKIYSGKYGHILDVKPGLTSPASLYDYTHGEKYEDEEAYEREFLPKKLALELYYVNHRGLWYDIRIIARTVKTIIQKFLGKKNFPEPAELKKIQEELSEEG